MLSGTRGIYWDDTSPGGECFGKAWNKGLFHPTLQLILSSQGQHLWLNLGKIVASVHPIGLKRFFHLTSYPLAASPWTACL